MATNDTELAKTAAAALRRGDKKTAAAAAGLMSPQAQRQVLDRAGKRLAKEGRR
ncbi:hypothetical protein [Couchioplanes caeruleus]|uniref:Uncharacterized protein n=1 Tax=Couchioplanes caeruleus TaxID=56438 RepID=A0A3N1GGV9_9ACTN|nr:hypothetical protein [Couchioplanes caeruleus]ROP29522.1 hypothetical protein EDD30_2319 [Couchioplanes caeruleus]